MYTRRRRSLPWIHRWSRPIIGAIAIAGLLNTLYLTITKLTGGEVVCSANANPVASGCHSVLDSPYATVLGLPLSLFGCLAYLSMAIFALSPLIIDREGTKGLKNQLESWTWLLLLAGGTAMTVFSSYLMYVLAFKIQLVCYYCIASALFALSILVLTIVGRNWDDIGQIFFTGVIVAMLTLVGTLAVYANVEPNSVVESGVIPKATTNPVPPYGWEVNTTSGESELALAEHLQKTGAKMYKAFWCPHCYEQKQLFGKEAQKTLPLVECAPEGENPQTELCQQKNIQSFPTWEIKGKMYPGVQELKGLSELSEYKGSQNFKYRLK